MKITDAYGADRFGLSFELFPPKTSKGEEALFRHVDKLIKFEPSFITCTYGAGGTTRNKTLEIVTRVKRTCGVSVATHLTCVGATVEELRGFLRETQDRGIDNVVALRGDPPQGEAVFTPVDGGLRYANELVELIRREFADFGIAVAGYPETHQEAESSAADLENLKRKVDSGGDVVITQLFYDNADFFDFRRRCIEIGITAPIVPGVLPVTNFAQIQRITSLCGAKLPEEFVSDLEACGDDDRQFEIGVEFARRQVQELLDAGVPGVHFYVLNKSQATAQVLQSISRT